MTALFKKASILTLATAIAGGIVLSVGSSEPSTFEGQASAGTYSVVFDSGATFSGSTATKTSTPSSYQSKSITFVGGSATFPVTFSAGGVTEIHNLSSKILNMNTISLTFTGLSSATVFFKEDGGSWLNTSVTSGQVYDFSTQSVSPEFFDFTPGSGLVLESISITFSC